MIAWTDVESTGLDEKTGDLLEVALVVTDDQLVEVAATSVVILPSDLGATISKMDPYVKKMHTDNGLIAALSVPPPPNIDGKTVTDILTSAMVDVFKDQPVVMTDKCANCKLVLKSHEWGREIDNPRAYCKGPVPGKFEPKFETPMSQVPLAGSTVSFDRRWLKQHMPALEGLFSYRSIDVSTITELAKRFAPAVYAARPKAGAAHRALTDVRESINYLRYYRESGFLGGMTTASLSK